MSGGISFDPEAIRRLAEILRETDLTEIEVADKESRIRVARTPAPAAMMAAPVHAPAMAPTPAPQAPPAPAAAPALDAKHPGLVTSPMVGVVYLAPEPGAAPFVAVGARVEAGATLLLIEAMKTFNQIKAGKAGTVTRILVESGTPVEYGEPLVLVE
jgi:acetyl-CoA carboxylase biotin carboxyl carrier protein